MAKQLRMLAPDDFREKLSRRAFLKGGTAAAGFAIVLAACGSSDDEAVTVDTTGGDMADDGYSRVVNTASGTLAMYTWGDYNDPDLVGALADSTLGVTMKVDYYASNEDLITKLAASNGNSGFDIVVPTGPYVPQMIEKGLIQKLDMSLIPNFSNLDSAYTSQAWDPNNEYSVCKNWGSTGFFYDKTKITRKMETWQDFIDACMNEGSGNCAMIDTAPNFSHVVLGQRHQLEYPGCCRDRCLREVPRGRVRPAHQGIRQLPEHQARGRRLQPRHGLERRPPSGLRAHRRCGWQP